MKRIIGRKAEWLRNDRIAFIDTMLKPRTELLDIDITFMQKDGDNDYGNTNLSFAIMGSRNTNASNDCTSYLWLARMGVINGYKCDLVLSNTTRNYVNYVINEKINIRQSRITNTVYVNGEKFAEHNNETNKGVVKYPILIFNGSLKGGNIPFQGNISKVAICEGEVKLISLTPIQLTSDLPAYLASDNLPHSAGECGMWDSVSEKFYGNANTSGEFSVENELDEYVEVDLTGIAINGKYQRVAVENTEIPQIVWNGVNAKMLMLNGKVVWSDGILIGEGISI